MTLEGDDEEKKKEKMKAWAKEYNYGIMHYGIPPEKLPFSAVRIDVLHLSHAVTKKLMDYLRFFMNKKSRRSRKSFYDKLLKLKGWKRAHNVIWKLNKRFDCMTGN